MYIQLGKCSCWHKLLFLRRKNFWVPTGIEPKTFWLPVRHSNPLSYRTHVGNRSLNLGFWWILTSNNLLFSLSISIGRMNWRCLDWCVKQWRWRYDFFGSGSILIHCCLHTHKQYLLIESWKLIGIRLQIAWNQSKVTAKK